jgi:hypothetical protein
MKKALILILFLNTFMLYSDDPGLNEYIYMCRNYYQLKIIQDGREYTVTDNSEISLENKEFKIRFITRKYISSDGLWFGGRFSSNLNKALFSNIPECFTPGHSSAMYNDRPCDQLYVDDNDYGFQFIYFENENSFRANPVSELKNRYIELEMPISGIYLYPDDFTMENFNRDIYLVFFYDSNLNDTIENGEILRFTLKFQ